MQAAAKRAYWLVAVLDAAAERHLRQVGLAQSLVRERLGAGRAGEVECRDDEFEQGDVRREPAGHIVGSRSVDEVVDVVAPSQTGQHRDLSTAVQELRIDALPLRHRLSVVALNPILHEPTHCQGGWWGSADVRRCPLLQVNGRCGCQGTPADDRERHGLATIAAPCRGRLTNAQSPADA